MARRRLLAVLLVALAAVLAVTTSAHGDRPAAAASPASGWSAPRLIDQVPPVSQPFSGDGACPSASLCVVAGVDVIDSSTDPGAGPRAWRQTLLPGPIRITQLACPSAHECLGTFGFGRLAVSADPTGGPRAWRTVALPQGRKGVNGLACASVHLCVTVGGRLLRWSSRPLAGSRSWHTGVVRGAENLMSVSCPSLSLCVAADNNGNLAVSTRPRTGASSWHVVRLRVATTDLGVACPTAHLCLGSDGGQRLLVSTDPAAGRRAWHLESIIHTRRGDLDVPVCISATRCLADDGSGDVYTSTDPAGGPRAWHRHHTDFDGAITACAARRTCLAIDQQGRLASANAADPTHWRRLLTNGGNDLTAMACPSRRLCLAGDDAGNLLQGAGPRAARWRATALRRVLHRRYPGGEQVTGLACQTATTCLVVVTAADDSGDAGQLYAFDPHHLASSLRAVAIREPGTVSPEYVGRLACPLPTGCELRDAQRSGGPIHLVSADPADPTAWSAAPAAVAAMPPPRSACPSLRRCLAPGGHGTLRLFALRDGRWRFTRTLAVLHPGPVDTVACDRHGTCVAVGPGAVAVSHDPTVAASWRSRANEPLGLLPLTGACAPRSGCVVGGLYGKAVATRARRG